LLLLLLMSRSVISIPTATASATSTSASTAMSVVVGRRLTELLRGIRRVVVPRRRVLNGHCDEVGLARRPASSGGRSTAVLMRR
jgi:hypothetical protein